MEPRDEVLRVEVNDQLGFVRVQTRGRPYQADGDAWVDAPPAAVLAQVRAVARRLEALAPAKKAPPAKG